MAFGSDADLEFRLGLGKDPSIDKVLSEIPRDAERKLGKGFDRTFDRIEKRGQSTFQRLRKIMGGAGGLIAGAVGTHALIGAIDRVAEFDEALTRLAIQGHLNASEQSLLREEVMGVSRATGMAKEEILAAGKSIIDSTGDIDYMSASLENLSSLSRTSGADVEALGRISASLKNQFGMSADEANRMMRVLVEQGEQGSYTLEEMASTGQKVFSALRLAGVDGEQEIKDAMAYMQVFRVGFASAEEAATAYKGTVARLAQEQGKLKEMGVLLEEDGKARTTAAILGDVLEKVQDLSEVERQGALVKLFGTENLGLVTAMQTAYEQAGREGMNLSQAMEKYTKVTGSATDQAEKLARIQNSASGRFDTLKTTLDDIVVTTLATEENMENLGFAAEVTAKAFVASVEGIQSLAGSAGALADRLGLIAHGGRAEDAAKMSTAQERARRATWEAAMAPDGGKLSQEAQQFMAQYEGSGAKLRFMGMDPEKLTAGLGTAAAGAATIGALPLAAALGAAGLLAPKAQDYFVSKESAKFADVATTSKQGLSNVFTRAESLSDEGRDEFRERYYAMNKDDKTVEKLSQLIDVLQAKEQKDQTVKVKVDMGSGSPDSPPVDYSVL